MNTFPKVLFVLVDDVSYVCMVLKKKYEFLEAVDFIQAVHEATLLEVDVVCWHEYKETYDFPSLHGVVKRKMLDQIIHRRFVKDFTHETLQTSDGLEAIRLVFPNNGLVQNRASKCALGTVEEVLFGFKDGLNFQGRYDASTLEFNMDRVERLYKVSGARSQGNLVRCGKWFGKDILQGSDGFCGPDNGPACQECKEKQQAVPDKWKVRIEITAGLSQTDVCISMVPILAEEDTATGVESQNKSRKLEDSTAAPDGAERKSTRREPECIVCMTNPPNYAAVPCGHKCVCADCSVHKGVKSKCPYCNSPARSWVRVFDV